VVLTELEDDRSLMDELLAAAEDLDVLAFEADLDGDLSRLGALTEADFSVVPTDDDSDLARRSGSLTEAFLGCEASLSLVAF
jgi:hypothetical protein